MATHIHLLTPIPKDLTPSSDFHGYCTHMTHRHVGKIIQRNKNVKEWNLSTSSNCGEMDLNLALKTHLFSPNTGEERQAYLYRFKVSLGYSETISIIKKEKKKRKKRPIIYSLTRSVHILPQDSLGICPGSHSFSWTSFSIMNVLWVYNILNDITS